MKCNNLAKNGDPKVGAKKRRFDRFSEMRFLTDFCQFFNFGPQKMAQNQEFSQIPK